MELSDKDSRIVQVSEISTIITKEATIQGSLVVTGTIQINGKVEGEVVSKDTINVGLHGNMNCSSIDTKTIYISGKVQAEKIQSSNVHIAPSGVLKCSNLQSSRLKIDPGGVFVGSWNANQAKSKRT